MRKKIWKLVMRAGPLLLLLPLLLAVNAKAASFDCAKATTKVEKMICENPTISKLNDDLGKIYQDVMSKANTEDKQRLLSEQKHWLKYTRNVCVQETCFKHAYWSRQAELDTFFAPHSLFYKHESEKAEAIKQILTTQPFQESDSQSRSPGRQVCRQIFEDLKQMKNIRFVDPIVQAQSYEDPGFDPWKRQCKSEEPFHFGYGCDARTATRYKKDIPVWRKELSWKCNAGYGLSPFKLFELPPLDLSGKKHYVFYMDDYYGPMNQDGTKPSVYLGYSAGFYRLIFPGCKHQSGFTYSRGGVRNGGNFNSVFVHDNQYYLLNLYKEDTGSYWMSIESATEKNPNLVCDWTPILAKSN